MRHFKKIKSRRRGATAAELAILAPVLLAILFGIIEFGWLFMARQIVHHSAAEGVRLAILPGYEGGFGDTSIGARINEVLGPLGIITVQGGSPGWSRVSAFNDANPCESITVTVPVGDALPAGLNLINIAGFLTQDIVFTVTMAHPDWIGGDTTVTCVPPPPPPP